MRPNNSNKRQRGRNRSKNTNPLARSYESNGPDVKIRGSALQVADKYAQLARDAQSAGDRVMAENYFQHAEHYYRIVAQAYEQNGQSMRDRRDDRDDAGRDDGQPDIPHREHDDSADQRETVDAKPRELNGHSEASDDDVGLRRTLRANGKSSRKTEDNGAADEVQVIGIDAAQPEEVPDEPVATAAVVAAAEPDADAEVPAEDAPKPKRRTRTTRPRRTRRSADAEAASGSETSEQAS